MQLHSGNVDNAPTVRHDQQLLRLYSSMTATTYVCPQCKKKIVVLIAVSLVRCTTCQQVMTPPARKQGELFAPATGS
jgi:ribosomal protein L37AE/L43A